MARMARGVMTYEYNLDDEAVQADLAEEYPNATEKDLLKFFTDRMVDDILDNAYSDLAPCIEMEITDY
jgi:hypothetical protein